MVEPTSCSRRQSPSSRRSGARPGWSRTQLDWASACLVRGERERCATLLAAAIATVGTLDLTDSLRRHAELAAQLAAGS